HPGAIPAALVAMSETETASNPLLRAVAAAGDLAYEWVVETDQISWYGKPAGVLGPTTAQVIGTTDGYLLAVHPEDRAHRSAALQEHFREGAPYACAYRLATGGAGYVWINDRGAAEFDTDGRPTRIFGVIRQMAAQKEVEIALKRVAQFDELTGL